MHIACLLLLCRFQFCSVHGCYAGANPLLLTSAMHAIENPETHYDLAAIKDSVDWFNIMSYDYHGAFDVVNGEGVVNVHSAILDCNDGGEHHST
jgi:GH18 family chitinase